MEKMIFHLAEQTTRYLKMNYGGQPDLQFSTISYFTKYRESSNETPENIASFTELYTIINKGLSTTGKIHMLLVVHDALMKHYTPAMEEALRTLYKAIGIDVTLMGKFRNFVMEDDLHAVYHRDYLILTPEDADEKEMLEGSWIEDNALQSAENISKIHRIHFPHYLVAMFVEPVRAYIIRCMDFQGKLFDQDTSDCSPFRLLQSGSELSVEGEPVITFTELKNRFHLMDERRVITLSMDHIQYTNADNITEIHAFSSLETTGQLIGIIGREGVGKSTLLKLIAGKIKPGSGNISINGYDLWKHKYLLKGVIGFVPEEDLLFEELSVSDNLKLTARLYYSHLPKKDIEHKVDLLLSRMDLMDIKNVLVGKVDSKHIQPGQRRLLNIALELLREPQILLVDNALSGLGMSDACRVIKILHDYSFNGNLVVTSISQVDSETFKLFDKIWILDTGGYPIYNGSVKGASSYIFNCLKLSGQDINNIDPAQLLDWINYRLPEAESHVWKRALEPMEWHKQLISKQFSQKDILVARNALPARILKIPNLEIQLLIFSIRNFKCKFSRIHEILKAFLVGPVVALIVSFLLRTSSSESYTLYANVNLPFYQFISVVIAIFMGLIASVDEMNREQSIAEKEEYLEFSRFSYLNSKILYLLPIVAIQIFLYILTANVILGIRELFAVYWIVLFSSACFGSLLGLVLSSGTRNMNLIYKVFLPLILGMQLLLGGGIISYDNLNLGSLKYTPLIGDLMVSRWGYEALAVEQYKNNKFEKPRYHKEKSLNRAAFYATSIVPELDRTVQKMIPGIPKDSLKKNIRILTQELKKVAKMSDVFRFEYIHKLSEIAESEIILRETKDYITYLSIHFNEQHRMLSEQMIRMDDSLSASVGADAYAHMKQKYHSKALEELVSGNNNHDYEIVHDEIVPKKGVIFFDPDSDSGRASLFAPMKQFNGVKTETLWFNISIIWLLNFCCYIWVLFDFTALLRKNSRLSGL